MGADEPLEGCVPCPPEFAERYRRLGYWQPKTLGERLDDWAARFGTRIALVAGGERVSYAELRRRADRLAAALAALGVRRRDRVVLQLPNMPEFVYLVFALFRLGALPVMALPAHRETEIRHLLQFTQAVAYCAPASWRGFDYAAMARAIAPLAPALRHLLIAGEAPAGCASLEAMLRGAAPAALPQERPAPPEVALFMLSGGTTGLPKLIPQTHESYGCVVELATRAAGLDAESVFLAVLPIAHNFSFGTPGVLGALSRGATVVLAPSASPESAFPLIERERVTISSCVPAVALQWLDSPLRARHDLGSLRVLQVGGARMAASLAQRIRRELGATPQQVYGMAEGLNCVTRLDDPDAVCFETQGRPLAPDDEVLIVDAHGRPVAPGERGELITRGPYTVRGYFRAVEHNLRAFTPEGFYRSGDLVRMTPSGNLAVEGRIKDLINRGGEKISAEEIESIVLGHPAVQNAAVVAMPCRLMGERVCAYVVPRPGAALTLEALSAHLEQAKIARFKFPERLELVHSLPLTSVGKVSKQALREDIAAKLRNSSQSQGAS